MTTKAKLEPECGIKPDKQVIKFKGKKLDDDFATLSSYGIEVRIISKSTYTEYKVQVDHSLRNQSVSVSDH